MEEKNSQEVFHRTDASLGWYMGICQLCLLEKRLIKAHILPESLYAPLREDGAVMKIYPTSEGSYPKRAPVGVYDNTILCASCDGRIGRWDDLAQRIILASVETYDQPEEILAKGTFEIKNFNYSSLKLFFISLLWRSHLTRHEFFWQVSLGTWAGIARKMILDEIPGAMNDFAVILARYDHPLAVAMHNPQRIRIWGLNMYRYRLGQYIALIKVDNRPMVHDLARFCLAEGQPITVRVVNFLKSEEFRLTADSFKNIKE